MSEYYLTLIKLLSDSTLFTVLQASIAIFTIFLVSWDFYLRRKFKKESVSRPEKIEVYTIKDVFGPGTADEVWIPKVAAEDGIVITQDFNIQRTRHQRELYRKHGLGVVFLKPPSKTGFDYWAMINKIIEAWPGIKKVAKREKKPFAYVIKAKSKKLEKL